MKKRFFFLLFFLIAVKSFAQTDSMKMADIDKIKQEIKNNMSTFQKVEKTKDAGGGYTHNYFSDKELKLAIIYHKDQNIDKNVEWYFSNGQLVYSEQIWTNTATGKIVDDEKFYLADGHLFAWVKMDGKAIDKNSRQFKEFDAGLEAYSIKLKEP